MLSSCHHVPSTAEAITRFVSVSTKTPLMARVLDPLPFGKDCKYCQPPKLHTEEQTDMRFPITEVGRIEGRE